MKKIPLAQPQISWEERRAVNKVLKSLNLAQGPEVKAFESEFSKIVGDRDCVAVNSGTSALHVCLIALGIGEGDEVIVPSFTFAATANVVALVGATPIFIDIDPLTYCMDPKEIQKAVTPRTKAIIVVHLYGLAANMDSVLKFAKESSLLIIEDAAQAHLASINGETVGTFGDAAAFSFRNQGMEMRYMNEIPGYNSRMTDIHAAIGRVQLKKLEKMTVKRIDNAAFLSANLDSEFTPHVPHGYRHVFHQYTVRIKSGREVFAKDLKALGIDNDVYYPTQVHKLPSFRDNLNLPNTESATKEVLSLPVHPGLSKRDLEKIVQKFNKLVKINETNE